MQELGGAHNRCLDSDDDEALLIPLPGSLVRPRKELWSCRWAVACPRCQRMPPSRRTRTLHLGGRTRLGGYRRKKRWSLS
jgi:hypothetical protein